MNVLNRVLCGSLIRSCVVIETRKGPRDVREERCLGHLSHRVIDLPVCPMSRGKGWVENATTSGLHHGTSFVPVNSGVRSRVCVPSSRVPVTITYRSTLGT